MCPCSQWTLYRRVSTWPSRARRQHTKSVPCNSRIRFLILDVSQNGLRVSTCNPSTFWVINFLNIEPCMPAAMAVCDVFGFVSRTSGYPRYERTLTQKEVMLQPSRVTYIHEYQYRFLEDGVNENGYSPEVHASYRKVTPFSPLSINSWYYSHPRSINGNRMTRSCEAYQYRSVQ